MTAKEVRQYFALFDIDLDNNEYLCPDCLSPIFYDRRRWRCENRHKFSNKQLLHGHASSMDILRDYSMDNKLCNS